MEAVKKDLMHMKVTELKEELEARNEAKSGNKAWARLRRRLHAAIVRDYLQRVVVRRWMMCRGAGCPPLGPGLLTLLTF